jgi:hypothetical protein
MDITGGLNVGSSTDITLGLSTNAINGWGVTIGGKYGGLCHSAGTGTACATPTTNLIATVGAGSTTLSTTLPGSDGYGANATTVLAGASIANDYSGWLTNSVGAIASTSAATLVSKSTPNGSTTIATMKILATADQTQKAGTYYDTITLTATTVP